MSSSFPRSATTKLCWSRLCFRFPADMQQQQQQGRVRENLEEKGACTHMSRVASLPNIASTSMQPNLALGTLVKSRLAPEALPVPRCNPVWLWDCMRQHLGPKWSYVDTYAGHARESDTPHTEEIVVQRILFVFMRLCVRVCVCVCTCIFARVDIRIFGSHNSGSVVIWHRFNWSPWGKGELECHCHLE